MNAVVSGQAGVALLIDGEWLSSFGAGQTAEMTRRSPGEVPLLLGDAKDLQFLEGVELEEVRSRLEQASREVDALHLALILLDESLEPDTRRTAAEELDELLAVDGNLRFVENVLYAHPLPRGADLVGALAACPGNDDRSRHLLKRLGSLQSVITEVYFAWEQIREGLFDGKHDRAYARSIAAREGFFRDVVVLRAAEGSIDSFLTAAYLNASFRKARNDREILRAWLASLSLDQRARVEHVAVNLQPETVAESVENIRQVSSAELKQRPVPPTDQEVSKLLHSWRSGDDAALDQLFSLTFEDLYHMARYRLRREREQNELDPEVLLSEVYLKLRDQRSDWQNLKQFFASAGRIMQHLVLDHGRARQAVRQGKGVAGNPLKKTFGMGREEDVDFGALFDALDRLAEVDLRQAKIVELKFLFGLQHEEIAKLLDISATTSKRQWRNAKIWLLRELSQER